MTQTLKASDVRANWSQLLNSVFRDQTSEQIEEGVEESIAEVRKARMP